MYKPEPYAESLRLGERLAKIRHVVLDMDGTIYLGNNIFPYTIPFLERLGRLGIGWTFLTNNPTRSRRDYLAKLHAMGIRAGQEQLLTSADVTIDYLHRNYPQIRKLYLLGTPSMAAQFEEAGFTHGEDPDAVVVSFDTTLTYEKLCRAAWWVSRGLPYIATNPDRVCPTPDPTILVDCGSICRCIEEATGRAPEAFAGKPDRRMLEPILHKTGLEPAEVAVVGDRIYTDIALARNSGAFGVLVLSGETDAGMAAQSPIKGDLTVGNIGEFGMMLEEASGENRKGV